MRWLFVAWASYLLLDGRDEYSVLGWAGFRVWVVEVPCFLFGPMGDPVDGSYARQTGDGGKLSRMWIP